jgi:hypothetical protein
VVVVVVWWRGYWTSPWRGSWKRRDILAARANCNFVEEEEEEEEEE